MTEKGIYINSVVVWNAFWSHGHELTRALAKYNKILYFENVHLEKKQHSGLSELNTYPVPPHVEILRSTKSFKKINLFYAFSNQLFSLWCLWKVRRSIDWYMSYNTYDLGALILAKILGKKTIFLFVDEYDILTTKKKLIPLLRILLRKQLRHSDKVICTAKRLCLRAKKYNQNVFYYPNAANLDDLEIIADLKKEVSPRLKIGFVGHLGSWVDIDLIFEAAKKFPNADFEIVGDGESMSRLVQAENQLPNIILRGEVKHNDIYKYVCNFDLAIIPFVANQITQSVSPVKLFEYWLVKKPVLARRTEELEQFSDAMLLYDDHESFLKSLGVFLNDPARFLSLGMKGFSLVREKYNWQKYAENLQREVLI